MAVHWEEAQTRLLCFQGCWQSPGQHGKRHCNQAQIRAVNMRCCSSAGCSLWLQRWAQLLHWAVVQSWHQSPELEGMLGCPVVAAVPRQCPAAARLAGDRGTGWVPLIWRVTTGSLVLLSSFPPGPRVH